MSSGSRFHSFFRGPSLFSPFSSSFSFSSSMSAPSGLRLLSSSIGLRTDLPVCYLPPPPLLFLPPPPFPSLSPFSPKTFISLSFFIQDGMTPLHHACYKGELELIDTLLSDNSFTNKQDAVPIIFSLLFFSFLFFSFLFFSFLFFSFLFFSFLFFSFLFFSFLFSFSSLLFSYSMDGHPFIMLVIKTKKKLLKFFSLIRMSIEIWKIMSLFLFLFLFLKFSCLTKIIIVIFAIIIIIIIIIKLL